MKVSKLLVVASLETEFVKGGIEVEVEALTDEKSDQRARAFLTRNHKAVSFLFIKTFRVGPVGEQDLDGSKMAVATGSQKRSVLGIRLKVGISPFGD